MKFTKLNFIDLEDDNMKIITMAKSLLLYKIQK